MLKPLHLSHLELTLLSSAARCRAESLDKYAERYCQPSSGRSPAENAAVVAMAATYRWDAAKMRELAERLSEADAV